MISNLLIDTDEVRVIKENGLFYGKYRNHNTHISYETIRFHTMGEVVVECMFGFALNSLKNNPPSLNG